jgi:hypothetical protein
MALTVPNVTPYAEILKKAVDKWESFHSNCYDEELLSFPVLIENSLS